MSETNLTAVRYAFETTPGTPPVNPTFQEVLFTSSAIAWTPTFTMDDSITSDRQVIDDTQTAYEVKGDNGHRLRYGALDDMFAIAFMNNWQVQSLITGITGVTVSTNTTYAVAAGGTVFIAGMLVLASGFTNAANNGIKTITSSTSTTIVVNGAQVVETPPVTASIKLVGFIGAAGDLVATTNGLTSTALNFTTMPIAVGDWINLGGNGAAFGFNTAADNGFVRVSVITANALTFDSLPAGWAADAGTGKTIKIWIGDRLQTGKTYKPVTMEREYLGDDGVYRYRYFYGVYLGVTFDIKAKALVDVTFQTMGMATTNILTGRMAGATTTPSVAGHAYDGSNNVKEIRVAGNPLIAPNLPINISMQLDNQFRGLDGIGTLGYANIRAGTIKLTGTLDSYMGDGTLLNYEQNGTEFDLAFPMLAVDGSQGYYMDIPRSKFESGSEDVKGKDQDITPGLGFVGLKPARTPSFTAQLQRYPYLE